MMRSNTIASMLCVMIAFCYSAISAETLKFADILTDNMVLQRGKEIRCWGTAPAGSEVEVLLTQSRQEVVAFAGEDALERAEQPASMPAAGVGNVKVGYIDDAPSTFKVVRKTVKADENGKWDVLLDKQNASFVPTFIAARSGDADIAIQNLLIGEVWIASGQSNMEWGATRDKMWENKGLIFNAVRYAKVRGGSSSPMESFVEGGENYEPWIVCEDGAVDRVSTIAYLFAQYLHRRLKVPVGIVNIAQGGSFAREWCSREQLELMESPTLKAQLAAHDEKTKGEQTYEGKWRSGPAELYNARLYPIRKMAAAGVIYMQGENESLSGDNPQYDKTFPGVIRSYREALGESDLPFGIITLQGYGGYQATREIHYKTHQKTPNTGYIVAHDIGGNIHPSWKRPLAERAVYWALRDVYGVINSERRLRISDVSFNGGKAKVLFEKLEMKNGKVSDPDPALPWTNDQQRPAGFEIAGEDHVWYRARISSGLKPEDGLVLSHAMVPEPVAVRYGWGGFPCGNLGSWEDPLPPYRSDDWSVVAKDEVSKPEADGLSVQSQQYFESHEQKNRELELGLRLAVAESYENFMKRYAHPKGMFKETVKNMQDLLQVFEPRKAEELAPGLQRHALHSIACRYWNPNKYTPERRAKWGWLIERVLRLEELPEQMEEAADNKLIKKHLAKVEDALEGLRQAIDKLDDPEETDFDQMLDRVLVVMEKEKQRLKEEEGMEKLGGGSLSNDPF